MKTIEDGISEWRRRKQKDGEEECRKEEGEDEEGLDVQMQHCWTTFLCFQKFDVSIEPTARNPSVELYYN